MKPPRLLFFIMIAILAGCKSGLPDRYHMDRRYWTPDDYREALNQIEFYTPDNEGNPRLSDPETSAVFDKLANKENVSVILEDTTLGLEHRYDVAKKFFDVARDLWRDYEKLDIQDKYVYPVEFARVSDFWFYTQLLYFRLGNDNIVKGSVNPDSEDVRVILSRNAQTIVNNFDSDLTTINNEAAFNDAGKHEMAGVISRNYIRLVEEFPKADFIPLRKDASILSLKLKDLELRAALDSVIKKIDEAKAAGGQ